jgi:predicted phage replisome organizer
MASEVKWLKISNDIFDDEKIILIESFSKSDSLLIIWFKLLCLASKQNNGGVFVLSNGKPYTKKMLATIFKRKESIVSEALEIFEEFGMIAVIDGIITIPNWEKHQNTEKLNKIREQTKKRVAEHRKNITCNANVTQRVTQDVTQCNATDKEEDKDIDIYTLSNESVYSAPTLEECVTFCKNENLKIDAERFFSYYQAIGWKTAAGTPISDWKSKARAWDAEDRSKKRSSGFSGRDTDYGDSIYADASALEV